MKDRLKRRVTGEGGSSGPVGWVRYTGFSDRSGGEKGWENKSLGRKQVSGPSSGHFYTFRQHGNASNECSQWLPIRRGDFEAFEEADGFEVRRDEP